MRGLLGSVHDVSPGSAAELESFHEMLGASAVGSRYCLFLVPDFWNREPLTGHPDFCSRVRELMQSGVEVALHGYTHLAPGREGSAGRREEGGLLTAGEDEFHRLSREEASTLLQSGSGRTVPAYGQHTSAQPERTRDSMS